MWGAEGMWERKGAEGKIVNGGKKKEMVALAGWALGKCGFVAVFLPTCVNSGSPPPFLCLIVLLGKKGVLTEDIMSFKKILAHGRLQLWLMDMQLLEEAWKQDGFGKYIIQ